MFFLQNVDKAHSQLSLKLQHPKLFGDHPNVSGKKRLNPGYQVSFLIPKSESPRLDGQLLECRTQKPSFAQRDFLVSPKSKSRKFRNAFNFTRFQLLLGK
ncbi:hypothetical protein CDAR_403561 [Caerostris darwini]|uniref:Uncharacterized protein n=1 Tax=Caerostris darwini TaxID=1538125 RepID=A0AAV4PU29_9ARAC|nr:hypothetical protein CDAR_403561 [Caerostris darwini]